MAKYLSNIDLVGNQLQNAIIHAAGVAPTALAEGQIYYNTASNKLFINTDGTSGGWLDVSGDIKEVIAGSGLTGGGSADSVTINIGSGDGITVNADNIALSVNGSQFEFVTGSLTISEGAIGANELASTGVTAGSYGSATAIPTFTVDNDGRLTAAGEASIQTSFDITDGVTTNTVNGGDTVTFSGTANEVTVDVSTPNTITIGLPNDVTIGNNLVVSGNLTVSGSVTTVNTETINLADNIITLNSNATGTPTENAGIEVERGDSDNVSLYWDEAADRWKLTYLVGPGILTTSVIPVEGEYNNYVFYTNGDTGSEPVPNGEVLEVAGGDKITTAVTRTTGKTTVTVSHDELGTPVSDIAATGLNVVQNITFDAYGHVDSASASDITSAVDARITARQFKASIGNGSDTSYVINHNLNSRDLIVQLFDNSSYDTVFADVVRTDANNITVSFAAAPSLNDIRVLINKIG